VSAGRMQPHPSPVISLSQWKSGPPSPSTITTCSAARHCLQRRTVRLRQGRRRRLDGHRHPTGLSPQAAVLGAFESDGVAFEGQWGFRRGQGCCACRR